MQTISKNIKIDLHIHSNESGPHEPFYPGTSERITDFSKKENIEVLFEKLNSNEISVFSITDHNSFNYELYIEIDKKMNEPDFSEKFPFIKSCLPGIELKVKFEVTNDNNSGDLNVYFDTKSPDDYKKIFDVVNTDIFKKITEFSVEDIKKLVKEINLDVFLVASQTKGLTPTKKGDKKGNSALSDHTNNPDEYIYFGYINALELKNTKTEGILIDDFLKRNHEKPALIKFSDCHDWQFYPKHDRDLPEEGDVDYFTSLKCQPTFKGILYSFTCPKYRVQRIKNSNANYITKIMIGEVECFLDESINVIIGNNGSGKSFLLEMINQQSLTEDKRKIDMKYSVIANENNIKLDLKDKKVFLKANISSKMK